jgi:hypothetical protein|tara:strand:- start:250 stop:450 length:201 start_codon:yes stop_codon:yes gene_type:complete
MLNIIVLVATAMGIVAFGGLGYTYGIHVAYDVGGLDVYMLFASGVGVGVCAIGLWNAIVDELIYRS